MAEYIEGAVHGGANNSRSAKDAHRKLAIDAGGAVLSTLDVWAREGRVFVARDGDENDTVLGATSYAATTPTFLLVIPDDTVGIPLSVRLVQVGTVAGDNISVHISADSTNLFSSGGTSETIKSTRTDNTRNSAATFYSAATAAAATASRIVLDHDVIAEDVDPASADAARFDYLWTPATNGMGPVYLVGPASFLVYTYAATTGPTWRWSVVWAEIPESEL